MLFRSVSQSRYCLHVHTEWFRVNMFGKIVESLIKPYVKKGSNVTVQGTFRTRTWEKDGQQRSTTELRADVLRLGPSGNGNTSTRREESNESKPSAPRRNEPVPANASNGQGNDDGLDDDIPF